MQAENGQFPRCAQIGIVQNLNDDLMAEVKFKGNLPQEPKNGASQTHLVKEKNHDGDKTGRDALVGEELYQFFMIEKWSEERNVLVGKKYHRKKEQKNEQQYAIPLGNEGMDGRGVLGEKDA